MNWARPGATVPTRSNRQCPTHVQTERRSWPRHRRVVVPVGPPLATCSSQPPRAAHAAPPPSAPPRTALSPYGHDERKNPIPISPSPLSHSPLLPSRSAALGVPSHRSAAGMPRSPGLPMAFSALPSWCRGRRSKLSGHHPTSSSSAPTVASPVPAFAIHHSAWAPPPWGPHHRPGAPRTRNRPPLTSYRIIAIALPRPSHAVVYQSPGELPVFPTTPNHFPTAPRTSENQFPTTSSPVLAKIGRPPPPARHSSASPTSAMGLEAGGG
jgi:hypothetical protein